MVCRSMVQTELQNVTRQCAIIVLCLEAHRRLRTVTRERKIANGATICTPYTPSFFTQDLIQHVVGSGYGADRLVEECGRYLTTGVSCSVKTLGLEERTVSP